MGKGDVKIARIYLRVSTKEQELHRQEALIEDVKAGGYYIAGVYRDKASGVLASRPELDRLINDLQVGDVLVCEAMDRLTRMPVDEAERLIEQIKSKGATLSIPGVLDLSEIIDSEQSSMGKIVLEGMQKILLRIALQQAREDYLLRRQRQRAGIEKAKTEGKYNGRKPNKRLHHAIVELRQKYTVADVASKLDCHTSTISRVCKRHKEKYPDIQWFDGRFK